MQIPRAWSFATNSWNLFWAFSRVEMGFSTTGTPSHATMRNSKRTVLQGSSPKNNETPSRGCIVVFPQKICEPLACKVLCWPCTLLWIPDSLVEGIYYGMYFPVTLTQTCCSKCPSAPGIPPTLRQAPCSRLTWGCQRRAIGWMVKGAMFWTFLNPLD